MLFHASQTRWRWQSVVSTVRAGLPEAIVQQTATSTEARRLADPRDAGRGHDQAELVLVGCRSRNRGGAIPVPGLSPLWCPAVHRAVGVENRGDVVHVAELAHEPE